MKNKDQSFPKQPKSLMSLKISISGQSFEKYNASNENTSILEFNRVNLNQNIKISSNKREPGKKDNNLSKNTFRWVKAILIQMRISLATKGL